MFQLMSKTIKTATHPVTITLVRDGGIRGYIMYAETKLAGRHLQVERIVTDEEIVGSKMPDLMKHIETGLLEQLSRSAFREAA